MNSKKNGVMLLPDKVKLMTQTGDSAIPASLPYGQGAVAKDGTVYFGDENNTPVSQVATAKTLNGKSEDKLAPKWENIQGKPDSFTPSSHTHDDRYYTESEIDSKLSGKANTSGSYPSLTVGNATNAGYATSAGSARASNITMSTGSGNLWITYS